MSNHRSNERIPAQAAYATAGAFAVRLPSSIRYGEHLRDGWETRGGAVDVFFSNGSARAVSERPSLILAVLAKADRPLDAEELAERVAAMVGVGLVPERGH